jgi:TusA-related sulfurtransferase
MAVSFAHKLDLRELRRPDPLLHLAQALIDPAPGDVLQVITADPTTVADLARWTQSNLPC